MLQARTTGGADVELQGGVVDTFRSSLRGPLILAGDAGYDDCRSIWNAAIDRRPGLIARCLGVADVVACVRFAREHDLLLTIKGGGHNIAGLAVADGGLMLDMSLMRGVWVAPKARTARAQAGCLLGDVDRETQLHGLAAVLGFVSNTGIAGLTLGGGFGYLTRRYGWTTDNVAAMEMVCADGRIVRASPEENEDLFWGLRGGGGNFGVVTAFEYDLVPVGPQIVAGAVAWHGSDAGRVLEMYADLVATAPPELTCVAALRVAPPSPWLPKEVHGKPIVALFVCHTGSIADATVQVEAIKTFGSPIGDILQPRSYVSQQGLLDATQPKGRRYYWKSEYLPRLDPALLTGVIEHAGRAVSPHSAILLFPVDGAINRVPESDSPAGNRSAAVILNVAASWDKADDDQANVAWARAAWEDLRRFSTGGTYVNFLTADDGDDRVRAAYGANYARLAALKARWDPDNLFRANKNIRPAA